MHNPYRILLCIDSGIKEQDGGSWYQLEVEKAVRLPEVELRTSLRDVISVGL